MNWEEMFQRFVAELPASTGRTLEEWRREIREHGPALYQARIDWLRSEHRLSYRAACLLAQQASDSPADYGNAAGLVREMYAGEKAALLPIYERLLEIAMDLGPDVTKTVAKTIVSLKRKHVFAQIKPATKTRVDLGFAFPRLAAHSARLVPTGGLEKGDRISYRVGIAAVPEIDEEVVKWLREAYAGTASENSA